MTTPYEVPAEMRDFAERSVAQARKAFEGFIGAVQKTAEQVDTASASVNVNAKGVSSKAVSLAEKNVTAAFDLADKLVKAKDVQEVIALQTEFMKAQMEAIQAQTKELGEAVTKATGIQK